MMHMGTELLEIQRSSKVANVAVGFETVVRHSQRTLKIGPSQAALVKRLLRGLPQQLLQSWMPQKHKIVMRQAAP